MKKHGNWLLMGVLFGVSLLALPSSRGQDVNNSAANPRGTPPSITPIPMAPRLDTLDSKTVYLVDVGFKGVDNFFSEMMDWFSQNIPKANIVFRKKAGSYEMNDSELWKEIEEKGDAVILAVGH